jgi:hypothetical protein
VGPDSEGSAIQSNGWSTSMLSAKPLGGKQLAATDQARLRPAAPFFANPLQLADGGLPLDASVPTYLTSAYMVGDRNLLRLASLYVVGEGVLSSRTFAWSEPLTALPRSARSRVSSSRSL